MGIARGLRFTAAAAMLAALGISCSGGSDGGGDSASSASSSSSSSSSSSTAKTAVSVVGSLSFTSSAASSTALALADEAFTDYWLKCITLDLTNASACTDQLDSAGAFTLGCDSFKGKAFGCFVLKGTKESDLTIAGVLSSKDLVIGESSSTASLGLSFDPKTGAVSIINFEQADADDKAVEADAVIAPEVAALDIEDGTYGFCFTDLDSKDKDDVGKGKVKIDFTFDKCNGRTEEKYLHFSTAKETEALPVLEMWKSKADHDSCYVNGKLTYQISDGKRTYSFTEDKVSFDDLFDKIYNKGTDSWVPSAAIEAYQVSQADSAQKDNDMKDNLAKVYGDKICDGIVDDLIAAYEKATLKTEKGVKSGKNYAFKTGAGSGVKNVATVDAAFSKEDEGPPPEWCTQYLGAATDDDKEKVKKRFIGECKAHVENDGGDEIFQKQQLVWSFLESLGELRRQGSSDNRFTDLRDAFELVTKAGIDLSETGIDSMSETCDKGTGDQALADLAKAWKEVDWNWERARFVENATASDGTLVCKSISFDHFGKTKTFANGRALLKTVLAKKFNDGDPDTGVAQINSQICQDTFEFDFSKIDPEATYFKTFWGKMDTSSGFDISFKSSLSEDEKETAFKDFLRALTAKTGETGFVTGGPFMFGCGAIRFKDILKQMSDTSVGGGGRGPGVDDMARQVSFQINDFLLQHAIAAINTSPSTGTSPLTALSSTNKNAETDAATQLPAFATKVANLAIDYPNRYGWLLNDLCNFVDLSTLTLKTTGIACGEELPSSMSSVCGFGGGQGGPGGEDGPVGEGEGGPELKLSGKCELPSYNSKNGAAKKEILANLAQRVSQIKGQDAFRTDETFKEKRRAILANSACLPDAALGHSPIVDDDDKLTFEVVVRGPVKRNMAGQVNIDLNFDEKAKDDDDVKFIVEDSRIQKEEGGMGSEGCYWGETQRLKGLIYDDKEGTLKGTYTQGFVDTCRNANSSDQGQDASSSSESAEKTENAWYQSFQATKSEDSK